MMNAEPGEFKRVKSRAIFVFALVGSMVLFCVVMWPKQRPANRIEQHAEHLQTTADVATPATKPDTQKPSSFVNGDEVYLSFGPPMPHIGFPMVRSRLLFSRMTAAAKSKNAFDLFEKQSDDTMAFFIRSGRKMVVVKAEDEWCEVVISEGVYQGEVGFLPTDLLGKSMQTMPHTPKPDGDEDVMRNYLFSHYSFLSEMSKQFPYKKRMNRFEYENKLEEIYHKHFEHKDKVSSEVIMYGLQQGWPFQTFD
jgi:hypothetical protein